MRELLPNIHQATIMLKVGPTKVPAAMHIVKSDDEVILIDPFALPESETEALEALGKPTLILIAGENHVRQSEDYRERYGAKILANREGVPKLGIAVDDTFGDGETLPGGLTTIGMPGTMAGETIFRLEQGGGVLVVGDAIVNFQPDQRGFVMRLLGFSSGLGTMPKLFMKDKKLAAASYQKLLDYDFDQLFVSHGPPILSGAKVMLRAVLEKQ